MSSFNRIHTLLTVCLSSIILIGNMAGADALHGMKLNSSKLEARGLCSSGACLGNLSVPGADQVNKLLHKISIFGEDDRVIQARVGKDIGYAPIGGLVSNQPVPNPMYDPKDPSRGPKVLDQTEGTAQLVSPCHVLTNYHMVFGGTKPPKRDDKKGVEKFKKSFSASFYVASGESEMYEVVGHPVKWGQFESLKSDGEDWTLLELENCVGKDSKVGWMEIDHDTDELYSKSLVQAGFPGDKDRTYLWIDPSCKAYSAETSGKVVHDCASRGGSSGSPIMYIGEDGAPRMVAIETGDSRPEKGSPSDLGVDPDTTVLPRFEQARNYSNTAVGMYSIYREIAPFIEEAKRQYGKPNPVLARLQGEPIKPVSATQPNPHKVPRKRNSGADI